MPISGSSRVKQKSGLPEIGIASRACGVARAFRKASCPGCIGPGFGLRGGMSRAAPMRHEIIPNLRYADALRAIAFLCDAFGFERRAVYRDEGNPDIVAHAQLVWRDRMVMVTSALDSPHVRAAGMNTAAEAGGATVGLYLIVDDVDAHAERARAAGADIFEPPEDKEYGGRGYSARDIEGNVWSFGSYDPWG
jgi:uncharacterized glyoxalase superfamily protein PhnB